MKDCSVIINVWWGFVACLLRIKPIGCRELSARVTASFLPFIQLGEQKCS